MTDIHTSSKIEKMKVLHTALQYIHLILVHTVYLTTIHTLDISTYFISDYYTYTTSHYYAYSTTMHKLDIIAYCISA